MITPGIRRAIATVVVTAAAALVVWGGVRFTAALAANRACCALAPARNLVVTAREMLGLDTYVGEIGQDKWILEAMFPGVRDGFFLDVGSSHGTIGSNSWALERRGWTGLCVDPFPLHMEGRTCRVFRDVVFSEAGRRLTFHAAGGLGGVDDTLPAWNTTAQHAPAVEFVSVTLRDILARAAAPAFIHFVSLDIEGAELEALRGFPFDTVRVGGWAIEHNREEPKRSAIKALLAEHGYERVHTWRQDDYYAPRRAALASGR
jgi:hypothetical protein